MSNFKIKDVASAVYDLSLVIADIIEYGNGIDEKLQNERIMRARINCFLPKRRPMKNKESRKSAHNSQSKAQG